MICFFNISWLLLNQEIIRTHQCIVVVVSVDESCPFAVVRVMFGIPKRVTSLCSLGLSEVFSLFLGANLIAKVIGFPLIRVKTRVAYQ